MISHNRLFWLVIPSASEGPREKSEILRFAQNDTRGVKLSLKPVTASPISSIVTSFVRRAEPIFDVTTKRT